MRDTSEKRLRLDALRARLKEVWAADVFDVAEEISILREMRNVLGIETQEAVDRQGAGLRHDGLCDVPSEVIV